MPARTAGAKRERRYSGGVDLASAITALVLGTGLSGSLSAGVVLRSLRRSSERRRARDALREIAPLTAATPDGALARVTGTVCMIEGRALLAAPLTGRPCVAHRSRAAARGALARAQNVQQLDLCPFTIDGQVLVDSANTRLDLPPVRLRTSREQTYRYDLFLARMRLHRHNPVFGSYGPEFEEVVVEPGMRVTVAGLVMYDLPEDVRGELGFRDQPPPRARLAGSAQHPIVIGLPVD